MNPLITITFSAFNTFKKAFEPLFAPVSIDDLTDDDIQNVIDNGTSATAWCGKDSEVPDAVTRMNDIKQMLNWKGDVTVSPFTSERNGKERSGFSVNLQRDKSRNIGLVAFQERLAGLVR
tara:strand:- start:175 stop:534 length:360 start_codon:yes stop_codon:yes gene_type:complete